ncbi:serine hydrolase domain-containing protein [Marinicella litoralis]|nr:serine hydrolase domain-containing protein [Marinicella litoralis]
MLWISSTSLWAEKSTCIEALKFYDTATFVQQIDCLRQAAKIPGLSFAVVKDQEVLIAAGLGYAHKESGLRVTAQTPFNIASVTKPLSAVAALRMVELGQLQLDRPIAEYSQWSDFCHAFSEQPSIFAKELQCQSADHTLRQLLSHTATGMPGTRFSYNPVLYSWASRPIMAVGERSFSNLVDQYVLQPAGMLQSARTNRDLPLTEDLAQRLAKPYLLDSTGKIQRAPLPPPQGDGAAGGVISTVIDLAKFDIAYDQGQLISAQSRELMMTPTQLTGGKTAPYGIGWFVQDYQGHRLVWHSGWWEDAYSAIYLKVPEQQLTFILLANSEGVWWDNPLDSARVQDSEFAQAFFSTYIKDWVLPN